MNLFLDIEDGYLDIGTHDEGMMGHDEGGSMALSNDFFGG